MLAHITKAHSTKLCKGDLSVKKSIDKRVAPVDRFVLHTERIVFVCLFVFYVSVLSPS